MNADQIVAWLEGIEAGVASVAPGTPAGAVAVAALGITKVIDAGRRAHVALTGKPYDEANVGQLAHVVVPPPPSEPDVVAP